MCIRDNMLTLGCNNGRLINFRDDIQELAAKVDCNSTNSTFASFSRSSFSSLLFSESAILMAALATSALWNSLYIISLLWF